MNNEELETRLKTLEKQSEKVEKLESLVRTLEEKLAVQAVQTRTLQDINEIQVLQRAYGYYLEHWMSQEVIDCFSDRPDAVLSLYEGTWLGKEGIRKYFGRDRETSADFIHQVMQLSPIIHVDAGGQTASGRWYSWGAVAVPVGKGVRQFFMGGIYECVYIKEDDKWKIFKLQYSLHISASPGEGWVKPERLAVVDPAEKRGYNGPVPDIAPHGMDSLYPSGYIFPFHYEHPVTGKETSEAQRNAALKYVPNRFARE